MQFFHFRGNKCCHNGSSLWARSRLVDNVLNRFLKSESSYVFCYISIHLRNIHLDSLETVYHLMLKTWKLLDLFTWKLQAASTTTKHFEMIIIVQLKTSDRKLIRSHHCHLLKKLLSLIISVTPNPQKMDDE